MNKKMSLLFRVSLLLFLFGLPLTGSAERQAILSGPSYEEMSDSAQHQQNQIYKAIRMNDWSSAQEHSQALLELRQKAYELAKQGSSEREKHWSTFWLARAYASNGNFGKSEEFLLEAKEGTGEAERQRKMTLALVELSERFEQWEKASTYTEALGLLASSPIQQLEAELMDIGFRTQREQVADAEKRLALLPARIEALEEGAKKYNLLSEYWQARVAIAWKQNDRKSAQEFRLKSLESRVLAHKLKMAD